MSDNKTYLYFTLIASMYCVLLCCGDLLAARIILITSIPVSAGSFITVLNYIISNLVTEVYGYKYGRQLIWLGIFAVILFPGVNYFFNSFTAPSYWHYKEDYDVVFNFSVRTTISYIIAILIGEFLNITILSKLKILVSGKYFLTRMISSSIIGEIIYIIIFYLMLMMGKLPMDQIAKLMLSSFVTKAVFSAIAALPTKYIAKVLKKIERCDTFDFNTNYNPFKFLIN